MIPSEYGRLLAKSAPPLTAEQVEQAARMYAINSVEVEAA